MTVRTGHSPPRTRRAFLPVAAVWVSVALALGGCGRLASQLEEPARPSASSAALGSAPAANAPPTPAPPSSAPGPTPTPGDPPAPTAGAKPSADPKAGTATAEPGPTVKLSQSQQQMVPEVQAACRELLAPQRVKRVPGERAGACVEAAMREGKTARQVLSTDATGLPAGTHEAEVRTAPDFGLDLVNEQYGVRILVTGGSGFLLTAEGGAAANPAGGPEERYAAVLVEAASATSDPAALRALLSGSAEFSVDYASDREGMLYTRLTASQGPELQGVRMTSFQLWLDDLFRPAEVFLQGSQNEIQTTLSARYTQWGAPVDIPQPPLAELPGLR